MRLPIELINYCLYLAYTGTILTYNKKTGRHEIYIDKKHDKYYPIYQLLHYRSTNTVSETNTTIIEFPFMHLDADETKNRYFVSQLSINQTENELSIIWNPYILTKKSRSYSLDISTITKLRNVR